MANGPGSKADLKHADGVDLDVYDSHVGRADAGMLESGVQNLAQFFSVGRADEDLNAVFAF